MFVKSMVQIAKDKSLPFNVIPNMLQSLYRKKKNATESCERTNFTIKYRTLLPSFLVNRTLPPGFANGDAKIPTPKEEKKRKNQHHNHENKRKIKIATQVVQLF